MYYISCSYIKKNRENSEYGGLTGFYVKVHVMDETFQMNKRGDLNEKRFNICYCTCVQC